METSSGRCRRLLQQQPRSGGTEAADATHRHSWRWYLWGPAILGYDAQPSLTAFSYWWNTTARCACHFAFKSMYHLEWLCPACMHI